MTRRFPTTLRIAVLAMLLALSSNLLLIGFLYLRTRDDSQAAIRERIIEEAHALAAVAPDTAIDKAVEATLAGGDSDLIAARFDEQGRRRAGNIAGDLPPSAASDGPGVQIGLIRVADRPAPIEAGYVVRPLGADGWLVTGRALGERYALQQTLERSLLLGLVLALALGVACGLLIAQDVGRRVAALTQGVDQVGAGAGGALDRRLPISGAGDAFDALALRINRMLGRIERLMTELRLLTDSLAHDLRSPLGRIRARIERAVASDDAREREVLLGGVLQETDGLMRIIATVLEIGRSEAGAGREQFAALDPAALVAELGEMYEPLAEEAGIALVIEAGTALPPLFGHQQLLAQALSNLIDNAMRYGGGSLTLFARAEGAGGGPGGGEVIRIGVADRGPGIAEKDRAVALRRFGRLDATRGTGGAGLGLALVEAIAHLHGGTLVLDDNSPGLIATILLPRAPAAASAAALDSAPTHP